MEPNVRWSGAYKDALPDSHFFYVDRACVRRTDSDGRSHPLSCRHFPYKDQQGNISLSHVRNAISRAPQSHLPAHVQRDVQRKARALLQHQDRMAANTQQRFPGFGAPLEVTIPNMPRYKQISGDMDPGKYGGLVARSDGDNALELFEIQPVRDAVGDAEAAEVGFPFWSKEAYYDLDDLRFDRDEVQHALQSLGLEEHELEAMTPDQRALAIAEALFRYGDKVEEAASGWSSDVVTEEVEWMRGAVAGADYIADEDDEFRREILGEDEDEDDEMEPNASKYWYITDGRLILGLRKGKLRLLAVLKSRRAPNAALEFKTQQEATEVLDDLKRGFYEEQQQARGEERVYWTTFANNAVAQQLRGLHQNPNPPSGNDGPCVIFCDTAGRGYYTGSVRMVPHYSPQAMDAKVFADKTAAARVITSHGSMGGCHIYLLKPDDPNYPNPVPPRTPFTENGEGFRRSRGITATTRGMKQNSSAGHKTELFSVKLDPMSMKMLDKAVYETLVISGNDESVGSLAHPPFAAMTRDGDELASFLAVEFPPSHQRIRVSSSELDFLRNKGRAGVIVVVDNNEAQVVYYDNPTQLNEDWSDLETKLAGFEPNASSADRRRFEQIRERYIQAEEAYQEAEIKLGARWGHARNWKTYLKAADRKRLERLSAAKEREKDKFFELLQRISPRDWTYGVPSHWVVEKLPYEDAVRPANEPLSVEPPMAFGATASRT